MLEFTMISHDGAGWQIRPYRLADQDDCKAIFNGCLEDFPWRGGPEDSVQQLSRALIRGLCWVAEEPSAGVIGFVTLIEQRSYVDHLFIDADWRLCGVGRGLLDTARQFLGHPLTLSVDRGNHAAREAYAALGWAPTGEAGGRGRKGWLKLKGP
ncbi:MAG: GNAT family N-acetyltransferase [Pseudomonadota bacterium]